MFRGNKIQILDLRIKNRKKCVSCYQKWVRVSSPSSYRLVELVWNQSTLCIDLKQQRAKESEEKIVYEEVNVGIKHTYWVAHWSMSIIYKFCFFFSTMRCCLFTTRNAQLILSETNLIEAPIHEWKINESTERKMYFLLPELFLPTEKTCFVCSQYTFGRQFFSIHFSSFQTREKKTQITVICYCSQHTNLERFRCRVFFLSEPYCRFVLNVKVHANFSNEQNAR